MKAIVGFLFFMLFMAGFALVFLKGKQLDSPPAMAATPQSLWDVDWRPVSIGVTEIAEDSEMLLRFEASGKIVGHGGCNRFFGSYKVSENVYRIGPLGSTRMACPEPAMSLEQQFLQSIEKSTRILTRGEQLHLLGADNAKLSVLVPARTDGA